MKKITALLLTSTCVLAITNNSFGMEPKKDASNQNKKFDRTEQIQLNQKNNMLLQENNKLLRTIITQNHLIALSQRPSCYSTHSIEADYYYKYKRLDALYEEFKRDNNS